MVGRTFHFIFVAMLCAQVFVFNLSGRELADYRIGDTVDADIIAPNKFIVVDTESTDSLKQREAQRLPMIARFYPGVAAEAEASLRKTFINARNNFLNLVETQFHRKIPDPKTSDEFLQQVIRSPELDKSFPLTVDLAGIWARGESDEQFLNSLADRVRGTMRQFIFPAQVPEGWRTGNAVRLVALTNANLLPTPELVAEKGFTVSRSNIVSFTRARTDFRDAFPSSERAWANFAVQFLKENCAPDLKLTEAARTAHTASVQMGDTYQAGQIIARRGDVVNRKILVAIEQLRAITAIQPLPKPTSNPPLPVAVAVPKQDDHWLWFALGMISLVAAAAIWKLKRRPATSLLPARIDSSVAGTAANTGSRELRDAIAPHLARLLENKLTQRLISQRTELLAMQEIVVAEINELEARLEQMHAPLQERLSAYEKRIAELEQQLAEQAEQNRELIKAKIEGVKQQMEIERAKNRLKFN